MIHPFFTVINSTPTLVQQCRMDITDLPEPYKGKNKLKAILLGADPTNKGFRKGDPLVLLDTVFGIGKPEYEKYFFNPQRKNLSELGIDIDNLYIQNVCRNYFKEQTSTNKVWKQVAKLWLPSLTEELLGLDKKLPVLATAEKIMDILIFQTPRAEDIYNMIKEPYFYSPVLNREVYPLYRHPKYSLTSKYPKYKEFLIKRING